MERTRDVYGSAIRQCIVVGLVHDASVSHLPHVFLVLVPSLAACAERAQPVARLAYENEGKVCLDLDTKVAPPGAVDASGQRWLVPDALLVVTVLPPQGVAPTLCLRAESQCSARLVGAELIVTSRFRYAAKSAARCATTATAGLVCSAPPLASGEHVLRHGALRGAFVVASELPLCFAAH